MPNMARPPSSAPPAPAVLPINQSITSRMTLAATAKIEWRVMDEKNNPIAANARLANSNPSTEEKNTPISNGVNNLMSKGMQLAIRTNIRMTAETPKNLPSTSAVVDTGEDCHKARVFCRYSSLKLFIASNGAIRAKTITSGAR